MSGNLDIFNDAGNTKQLGVINGNGNLTIAGIETEGTEQLFMVTSNSMAVTSLLTMEALQDSR